MKSEKPERYSDALLLPVGGRHRARPVQAESVLPIYSAIHMECLSCGQKCL